MSEFIRVGHRLIVDKNKVISLLCQDGQKGTIDITLTFENLPSITIKSCNGRDTQKIFSLFCDEEKNTAFDVSKGLHERIKHYRKLAGINQFELAKKIGVTPAQVSRYERGLTEPRAPVLLKIANSLNIDVRVLLGGRA